MAKKKRRNKPLNYTKAIIFCHGQSEYQMVDYIKSNLRVSVEIYSENKGKNSIQITSLKNHLKNNNFKNQASLKSAYPKIEWDKNTPLNFRIYMIMDTDDCKSHQKNAYMSKEMFRNHWAYEYIFPIYNIETLEDVLKRCNIIDKKSDDKIKKNYIKIFPTDRKYKEIKHTRVELDDFYQKIKKDRKSNLHEMVEYLKELSNT